MRRKPFQLFTIALNTGRRLEVDHALSVAAGEHIAVFIGPGSVLVYFDHSSVTEITDAPAHTTRPRKPKK